MDRGAFESPVWIYVGLHFARAVGTASEALVVLTEWPHHRRGPEHRLAMRACTAVVTGEADAETVRDAFALFAKKSGILAAEFDVVAGPSASHAQEPRAA